MEKQTVLAIEEKAKEKYPLAKGNDRAAIIWNERAEIARRAFICGATEIISNKYLLTEEQMKDVEGMKEALWSIVYGDMHIRPREIADKALTNYNNHLK